jgi:hypothetical protein
MEAYRTLRRPRNVEYLSGPFLDDFPVKRAGMNVFRLTIVSPSAKKWLCFVGRCDKSLWAMLYYTASSAPASRLSSKDKVIIDHWQALDHDVR